jgi:thioesterase domain-containing protein
LLSIGSWRGWAKSKFDFKAVVDRAYDHIVSTAGKDGVRLAGYSQGGQIAYATALALERAGRHVECVVLFDTPAGGTPASAYPKLGITAGVLAPLRDWLRATLQRRHPASLAEGDPRMRLLLGLRSLPSGTAVVLFLARLAPLVFRARTTLRLDQIIQMAAFEQMWTRWLESQRTLPALKAPVFLFRSQSGGPPDLGWNDWPINLTIAPVAGNHYSMFAPDHAEHLVRLFSDVVGASAHRSAI